VCLALKTLKMMVGEEDGTELEFPEMSVQCCDIVHYFPPTSPRVIFHEIQIVLKVSQISMPLQLSVAKNLWQVDYASCAMSFDAIARGEGSDLSEKVSLTCFANAVPHSKGKVGGFYTYYTLM